MVEENGTTDRDARLVFDELGECLVVVIPPPLEKRTGVEEFEGEGFKGH